MSAPWALLLCERLVAGAIFLQALEMMLLRSVTSDFGVWRWKSLQAEFGRLGPVVGRLLSGRGWPFLLVFQAVAAASVLAGWGSPALLVSLSVCVLLGSMRFLGTFNGGSDCMTAVVLMAVTAVRWEGSSDRSVLVGLGYIGFQLTLSYAVAGWVKLCESSWRSGAALLKFLELPQYPVSGWVRVALARRGVSLLLGWLLIGSELAISILALVSVIRGPWPPLGVVLILASGLGFHFLNAKILGLNRFLWAWLSAYPALAFWLSRS